MSLACGPAQGMLAVVISDYYDCVCDERRLWVQGVSPAAQQEGQ